MIPRRSLAALARHPSLMRPALSLRQPLLGTAAWRGTHNPLLQRPAGRAWETTTAAPPTPPATPFPSSPTSEPTSSSAASKEHETGHFDVQPNESLFFFESEQNTRPLNCLRVDATNITFRHLSKETNLSAQISHRNRWRYDGSVAPLLLIW